ncbi:histidine kinase [Brevibacillus fluminis]|uniref:Histidine kinase n=1 Tax=Brevibacillus fluminis TaxID=511487 RepID=A0A3M8DHB1_9BACL|nr:histidine kinase [Brevibacillus fluminis]RNB87434.1 histidine kinase [Brevibacillus fluminis]
MAEPFRRKSPEEILESIATMARGRLTIILGAVRGVGKTYRLLTDGLQMQKRGLDVVIGVLGAADHEQMGELAATLPHMPTIEWQGEDGPRYDLDVAAILSRDPEVVLVDGLAHRNAPGAPRPDRLSDIKELLAHKISVITTVNIYELAGVKEIADKLLKGTTVQVTAFVPEDTLALADEVKLLDVTPDAILARLAEGSLDAKVMAKKGAKQLYRRHNLSVLRELSLRIMAGEVNDALDEYRDQLGLIGPSGAAERILVTAQYHANGSILIRRGQQVANRLGAELLIVCFRKDGVELTMEEAAFRRAIVRLAEKVGGAFEEQVLDRYQSVPQAIVSYAMRHKVTRILMGQSNRSRWHEIAYGSICNRILRQTRSIDVLLVADKMKRDGERVMPALRKQPMRSPDPYRRLTTDEMKLRVLKMQRGHLKVYIGAAPGVGKTYTMLREGNVLLCKGIDVVIGLLETHGRKETMEQVGELTLIPRKKIAYRNVWLEEMDTDAIIARNPEVVLVDELAHTNVPGSQFEKRFQDVERLLAAGISVITTVNVQHLESLNDSVEQITGVRVRETVPDHMLQHADEVELIDIAPEALRLRMREGNIYASEKVEQALGQFFKKVNLIALRELALREVADDVDERLEAWERRGALRGAWQKQEAIFVCVNLRPDSERLIRHGFRIAYRLKADWYVAYVQEKPSLSEAENRLLVRIKQITERLGGQFVQYEAPSRRRAVVVLANAVNEKRTTQVIIGHSARTRLAEICKGSVVERLLRLVRHVDVLVMADRPADMGQSDKRIR